jgi:hypothetical protein
MLICFLNFLSSDNQYQGVNRPRPPHLNVANPRSTVNFVATVVDLVTIYVILTSKIAPFATKEVAL